MRPTLPGPRLPALLAAVLAAVALLAACSGPGNGGGGDGGDAARDDPVRTVRNAFATTAQAGPARIVFSARTAAAGQNIDLTGTGVLDLARRGADVQLRVPSLGAPIHTLLVDGVLYTQLPPQLASLVPTGKSWVSIDLNRASRQQYGATLSQLGVATAANPVQALQYLKAVRDDVRVLGPEPINGVPTTHYAATIDLDRTPAARDPATRPAVDRLKTQLGSSTLPVELWIDEDGRLRRVVQSVTSAPGSSGRDPGAPPTTSTTSITFTEFGVPARIVAPPPGEVAGLAGLLPR